MPSTGNCRDRQCAPPYRSSLACPQIVCLALASVRCQRGYRFGKRLSNQENMAQLGNGVNCAFF
jgi:hypothetical protein